MGGRGRRHQGCRKPQALARGGDRRGRGVLRCGVLRPRLSVIGRPGDNDALRAVAELAAAFAPSKERHLETTAQGAAFIAATKAAWPCEALERLAAAWDGPVAYPVAVGVAAAGHGIALEPALHAYLHAVTANLISAGVRLVPLGQSDGQRVLAALEPVVEATAQTRARHPARSGRRRARSAPTWQACCMKPSTRGCFAHEQVCNMAPCASASAARSAPARPR